MPPPPVPDGTCFCNAEDTPQGEASEHGDLLGFLLEQLELEGMPPPSKVRVGIISRRRKRFILNEDALVRATLELGFEVQILPLEDMTLYEQLRAPILSFPLDARDVGMLATTQGLLLHELPVAALFAALLLVAFISANFFSSPDRYMPYFVLETNWNLRYKRLFNDLC